MEKPAPSGPELPEVVWLQMAPTKDPRVRSASEAWVLEMYEVGVVDRKRFRLPQWQAGFQGIPREEEAFLISLEHFKKLVPFLYPAKIKKPFDPGRIKDGPRPAEWLNDLYLKVLRFETQLSFEAWKQLIADQVRPRFFKGEKFLLNPAFRQWLGALLLSQASPLRKLELWFEEKSQAATSPPSPEVPDKVPTKWESGKSTFQAKPTEMQKKAAIDQVFFHQEQHPALDDKESLDILDQLAEIEGEDSDSL